jgi:hypothetical protein
MYINMCMCCSFFSVTILRIVVKSKLQSCILVTGTFITITSSEALGTNDYPLIVTVKLVHPSFLWASYVSLPIRFILQCLLGYNVVSLLCKCYSSSVGTVVLPLQILHTQFVPNGLIPFPI